MVPMATTRRNNSNAGTMANSAMCLGVAVDHPAHDITQVCPKVAQQSRETPRAVDNRRRIWLAQTNNKTTPLHSRLPHWLWLCGLRSAADVRGKTQPQTNRAQSVVSKRTTPPHIRTSKNFFQTVWSDVLAQHDRGWCCSSHLGYGFFPRWRWKAFCDRSIQTLPYWSSHPWNVSDRNNILFSVLCYSVCEPKWCGSLKSWSRSRRQWLYPAVDSVSWGNRT